MGHSPKSAFSKMKSARVPRGRFVSLYFQCSESGGVKRQVFAGMLLWLFQIETALRNLISVRGFTCPQNTGNPEASWNRVEMSVLATSRQLDLISFVNERLGDLALFETLREIGDQARFPTPIHRFWPM
jgi:hypothetical protein